MARRNSASREPALPRDDSILRVMEPSGSVQVVFGADFVTTPTKPPRLSLAHEAGVDLWSRARSIFLDTVITQPAAEALREGERLLSSSNVQIVRRQDAENEVVRMGEEKAFSAMMREDWGNVLEEEIWTIRAERMNVENELLAATAAKGAAAAQRGRGTNSDVPQGAGDPSPVSATPSESPRLEPLEPHPAFLYTVGDRDTLFDVAQQFCISVEELVECFLPCIQVNYLESDTLSPGQKLLIARSSSWYQQPQHHPASLAAAQLGRDGNLRINGEEGVEMVELKTLSASPLPENPRGGEPPAAAAALEENGGGSGWEALNSPELRSPTIEEERSRLRDLSRSLGLQEDAGKLRSPGSSGALGAAPLLAQEGEGRPSSGGATPLKLPAARHSRRSTIGSFSELKGDPQAGGSPYGTSPLRGQGTMAVAKTAASGGKRMVRVWEGMKRIMPAAYQPQIDGAEEPASEGGKQQQPTVQEEDRQPDLLHVVGGREGQSVDGEGRREQLAQRSPGAKQEQQQARPSAKQRLGAGAAQLPRGPKLYRLLLRGELDPKVRGRAWVAASRPDDPGEDAFNRRHYYHLLQQPSEASKEIERDVHRTFPTHCMFKEEKGAGQVALYNVIKAYSVLDTEVGYCQGMGFIAATLLMHMGEEDAFCCLMHLMFKCGMRGVFQPDMVQLQKKMYQLGQLLAEGLDPAFYNHFQDKDIKPVMFAADWFLTLFARTMPHHLVARVFDIIFAEKATAIVFKLAIVLLQISRRQLQDCPEMEYCMYFLRYELPSQLKNRPEADLEEIVARAARMSLPFERFLRMEAEYEFLAGEARASAREMEAVAAANEAAALSWARDRQGVESALQFATETAAAGDSLRALLRNSTEVLREASRSPALPVSTGPTAAAALEDALAAPSRQSDGRACRDREEGDGGGQQSPGEAETGSGVGMGGGGGRAGGKWVGSPESGSSDELGKEGAVREAWEAWQSRRGAARGEGKTLGCLRRIAELRAQMQEVHQSMAETEQTLSLLLQHAQRGARAEGGTDKNQRVST